MLKFQLMQFNNVNLVRLEGLLKKNKVTLNENRREINYNGKRGRYIMTGEKY